MPQINAERLMNNKDGSVQILEIRVLYQFEKYRTEETEHI